MAQHDFVIANATGAAVRADLNNALAAIASNNSGSSEPTTTYAFQWWYDTTNNLLKLRNSANSAWITLPFDPTTSGEVNITANSTATADLAFSGGDVTFGDNDKAIFGAGSDLQIYHDGSHSYIADTGTGNLRLTAQNFYVMDTTATKTMFAGVQDAQSVIYYNGSQKLATTSTGIDVTGTVTADSIAVAGASGAQITVTDNSPSNVSLYMGAGNSSVIVGSTTSDPFTFLTANTERMRIDSSGNLLVGKTAIGSNVNGGEIRSDGRIFSAVSSNYAGYFNRRTNDGSIIQLAKDGTTVGSIGTLSGYFHFVGATNGIRSVASRIQPCTSAGSNADNIMDLGYSTVRWDDIYATNGTIQTSDEREKQDIDVLSDAERNVAVAAKGLIRKYRWKDAVDEKGDDARIHFGVIAQDLKAAFEAEGLDAGRYAMFIHSEWWETYTDVPAVEAVEAQDAVYDDEGNLVSEAVEAVEAKEAYTRTDTYDTEAEAPEGAVKKDRMGVRYPELLAFIIGAM